VFRVLSFFLLGREKGWRVGVVQGREEAIGVGGRNRRRRRKKRFFFFFCFFSLTSLPLGIFPGYPLDSFLPSFFSTRKIGVRVLGHRLLPPPPPTPRKKKERRKKREGGDNSSFSPSPLFFSLFLFSLPSPSVCFVCFFGAPACCHHFFASAAGF
jgi:hypothetical protein